MMLEDPLETSSESCTWQIFITILCIRQDPTLNADPTSAAGHLMENQRSQWTEQGNGVIIGTVTALEFWLNSCWTTSNTTTRSTISFSKKLFYSVSMHEAYRNEDWNIAFVNVKFCTNGTSRLGNLIEFHREVLDRKSVV